MFAISGPTFHLYRKENGPALKEKFFTMFGKKPNGAAINTFASEEWALKTCAEKQDYSARGILEGRGVRVTNEQKRQKREALQELAIVSQVVAPATVLAGNVASTSTAVPPPLAALAGVWPGRRPRPAATVTEELGSTSEAPSESPLPPSPITTPTPVSSEADAPV